MTAEERLAAIAAKARNICDNINGPRDIEAVYRAAEAINLIALMPDEFLDTNAQALGLDETSLDK